MKAYMKMIQLNNYVAPEVQVIEIELEGRILDASLNGNRNDYGTAVEETWN